MAGLSSAPVTATRGPAAIVHALTTYGCGILGTRAARRHGVPIVQTLQSRDDTVIDLPGLRVESYDLPAATTQFDLSLALTETSGAAGEPGLRGWLRYATDLFDADTVTAFGDRFVRVLAAVVADDTVPVGEIDLLAPAENAASAP